MRLSVYLSCHFDSAFDWSKVENSHRLNVLIHFTQRICPGYKTLTLQDCPACSPLIGRKRTNSQGDVLRHMTYRVRPEDKTLML